MNKKVAKKLHLVACDDTCQCREDLGLSCQTFSNGYTCYSSFLNKACLCNLDYYWDSSLQRCGF